MPVVQMPDGAKVQFPDDMPKEQIRAMILKKFPDAGKGNEQQAPEAQPKEDKGTFTANILPLKKDLNTGEISFAVPGMISGLFDSAKSAITAPGRAMTGELPIYGPDGNISPQAIQEGANFAMWATPASPASTLSRGPRPIAPKPKPEGLQVAEAAGRVGVDIPRAAVSDKIAVQQAGKTLSNVPIGGTPLRKASQGAIKQLDEAAMRTQQGYGSGSIPRAGSMTREGITDYAKTVLPAKVSERYDAVDKLVAPNVMTPLANTTKAATDILAKRGNAQMAGDSKAVEVVRQALSKADGMNYSGIKDLRSSVRELLDNPSLISQQGISQNELDQIYAGLSKDLRASVARSGGQKALDAFERANSYAAKKAMERQALQKVIGRSSSDEGIFDKLISMAGSNSRADVNTLMKARGAVGKDGWDEVASSVISRLGRDADGNFSPDRFLTGYGKLSKAGKNMLFNSTGKGDLAKSLEDIATVSRRFKQLNQYANPSGTGQTILSGGIGAMAMAEPMTAINTVAGTRVLSSMLSKPVSAKKLAAWAKAYEQASTKPSIGANAMLKQRAQVLAAELAAESGGNLTTQQLIPLISRIGQLPAEQGTEDNR